MAAGSSPDYGSPVTRPGRPQSGLIVEVPEADPVVGQHRALLDASAPLGVPAHITVLFPFMPPWRIDELVLAELEHLFAAVTRFRFRLDDTGWFGDDVLWLAPREPGPFRDLTRRVYGAFPAFPPFEGQYDDVVPHLTIGHGRPLNDLHSAEGIHSGTTAHRRPRHGSHPDDPAIRRRTVDQGRHLQPGTDPGLPDYEVSLEYWAGPCMVHARYIADRPEADAAQSSGSHSPPEPSHESTSARTSIRTSTIPAESPRFGIHPPRRVAGNCPAPGTRCSMFARMSQYGPVARGTMRHPSAGLLYGPARRSMTRHHAPLAQLAEQQTLNLRVRGSSPWRRTNLFPGHVRSARLPWCLRLQPGQQCEQQPPSFAALQLCRSGLVGLVLIVLPERAWPSGRPPPRDLRRHMAVGVHRQRDLGAAKDLHRHPGRHALTNQKAGRHMTEIMQPNRRQARFAGQFLEQPVVAARIDRAEVIQ